MLEGLDKINWAALTHACGSAADVPDLLRQLPASRRALRDLAAGKVPILPDKSLPLIADPSDPSKPLPPYALVVGRRIVHRAYGAGTVTSVSPNEKFVYFEVKFDEDGTHRLGLPADGSPWPPPR